MRRLGDLYETALVHVGGAIIWAFWFCVALAIWKIPFWRSLKR